MQYICIVNNQKRKVRSRLWPSVTSRKPTSGMFLAKPRTPAEKRNKVRTPSISAHLKSLGQHRASDGQKSQKKIGSNTRDMQKTATPKIGAFPRCSGCNYQISEQQFLSKQPDHIKIKNSDDFRSIASKVTCSQCGLKGEA